MPFSPSFLWIRARKTSSTSSLDHWDQAALEGPTKCGPVFPCFLGDDMCNFSGFRSRKSEFIPHLLHVWCIYLQNWVIFWANVGKYSIDGAYGYEIITLGLGFCR